MLALDCSVRRAVKSTFLPFISHAVYDNLLKYLEQMRTVQRLKEGEGNGDIEILQVSGALSVNRKSRLIKHKRKTFK